MKRAILILFFTCGMAGCKSQTPTVDPFFGRTTVPPPPTGSIAGQAVDPYYQSNNRPGAPMQPPGLQSNAPYNHNPNNYAPGRNYSNPTNAPSYAAAPWNNTPNSQQYSAPPSSALTGSQPTTATGIGASANPFRAAPQNNPALNSPPAVYLPQTPSAQPASMPATSPNSNLPVGNQYLPPGGNFNYRGSSTEVPGARPISTSPNRVATPYYAGGVPNRTSIPTGGNSPQLINNTQGSAAGTSPGSNYLIPASRQYTTPIPAQTPNNYSQPTWRESSSTDTRLIDDNIETVSNVETADTKTKDVN